jgi:hypothetical protein
MNKDGQFKIQQMSFMLLGTILFLILVGVFWLTLKSSTLNKDVSELKQQSAISLALTVSNSQELTCGEACIDMDKAFVIKDTRIMEELWPIKSLQIRRIYPQVSGETIINCDAGNYPDCNMIRMERKVSSNSTTSGSASSYVKLCHMEKSGDYTYKKCDFGEIIITT